MSPASTPLRLAALLLSVSAINVASADESGEARAHRLRSRPLGRVSTSNTPLHHEALAASIEITNVNLGGFGPSEMKCIERVWAASYGSVRAAISDEMRDVSLMSAGTTMDLEQPEPLGKLSIELHADHQFLSQLHTPSDVVQRELASSVPTFFSEERIETYQAQFCRSLSEQCSSKAFGKIQECAMSISLQQS